MDEQARQGLVNTNPQVVVLTGGTAALSTAVEQQVAAVLPDAEVRRFAGAGRTETARLVNTLTAELGVARPVLAGGTVTGDVGITGSLALDGTDVAGVLSALTARWTRWRPVGIWMMTAGLWPWSLILPGPTTGSAPTAAERTGSHYVVVGDEHQWTAVGGIVAGFRNTASGPWASVLGGSENTVSGPFTSVSGGDNNRASGEYASVSGGFANTASGGRSSVAGGEGGLVVADYYSLIGNELKDDTP